jgi:Flp pilus assembly pilin Flp
MRGQWFKSNRGATAIEYALIVAGLAVVIAISVFMTGGSLANAFQFIEGKMSSAAASTG